MKEKVSRRSFLRKSIIGMLGFLGIGGGGYAYAKYIEPKRLDIVELPLEHPLIPVDFNGFKIIQFSDTHLGFQYDLQQLKKHIEIINGLKPDMIFFTGDLMDEPNRYAQPMEIPPILKQLKAPLGKFAIYGNHDHGGYGTDIYKNTIEAADFVLLNNEAVEIKLPSSVSIHVAGIDDAMLGQPDISRALRHIPADAYTILLSHAPDLANTASAHKGVHCQLSGHSHGGQVKLPMIGPLITPPYAKIYNEGVYDVMLNERLFLYVNRGLGTTRLPFRLFSVPEITIFTLKNGKNETS